MKPCTVILRDSEDKIISAEIHSVLSLPRYDANENGSFLGWRAYEKLEYGRMNYIPSQDTVLYALRTLSPAYIINSHFRGDVNDAIGPRSHFRRYIVDIYIENSTALYGELKLTLNSGVFYYLGYIPPENTTISVSDTTEDNGGAYSEESYINTRYVHIKWSRTTAKSTHIARIMFAFSSWGMSYTEISRRTSDDIITPTLRFNASAGEETALVSANFYEGVKPEELPALISEDKNVETVLGDNSLKPRDMGDLLSRYAILSDSHIGQRYKWNNYNWLYSIYDNLNNIHQKTPLDFVVQLGDNIDDGYEKSYNTDYKIYLETLSRLNICDEKSPIENRRENTIPHYEIQGNHDTSMQTRFFRNKLWYTNSFGHKTAHIAFFTNYGGYPAVSETYSKSFESYRSYGKLDDANVSFVEKSIISAKENGAEQIVLYNHFGIASNLKAPILPETGLGKIEFVCKKYGVRLYFNGHEHNRKYTLHKYGDIYNYDAAMTKDAYSIVELYEKGAIVKIYSTNTNTPIRTDRICF